jgi:uncharacterized membrane protein
VAVARLLGHESAATTLNHYAGFFPTDLDDVASRLNAAARLTIAKQSVPSDIEDAPTEALGLRRQQDLGCGAADRGEFKPAQPASRSAASSGTDSGGTGLAGRFVAVAGGLVMMWHRPSKIGVTF